MHQIGGVEEADEVGSMLSRKSVERNSGAREGQSGGVYIPLGDVRVSTRPSSDAPSMRPFSPFSTAPPLFANSARECQTRRRHRQKVRFKKIIARDRSLKAFLLLWSNLYRIENTCAWFAFSFYLLRRELTFWLYDRTKMKMKIIETVILIKSTEFLKKKLSMIKIHSIYKKIELCYIFKHQIKFNLSKSFILRKV